jgi:hypothetical protein
MLAHNGWDLVKLFFFSLCSPPRMCIIKNQSIIILHLDPPLHVLAHTLTPVAFRALVCNKFCSAFFVEASTCCLCVHFLSAPLLSGRALGRRSENAEQHLHSQQSEILCSRQSHIFRKCHFTRKLEPEPVIRREWQRKCTSFLTNTMPSACRERDLIFHETGAYLLCDAVTVKIWRVCGSHLNITLGK